MSSTSAPTNGFYEGATYNSSYFASVDDITSTTIYISSVPTDPTFDSVITGTLEITTSGTSTTNATASDSSTQIATDEFVQNAIVYYADNNPATVPTDLTCDSIVTGTLEITSSGTSITNSDAADSSTQIATDEFVQNAIVYYAANNSSTSSFNTFSVTANLGSTSVGTYTMSGTLTAPAVISNTNLYSLSLNMTNSGFVANVNSFGYTLTDSTTINWTVNITVTSYTSPVSFVFNGIYT